MFHAERMVGFGSGLFLIGNFHRFRTLIIDIKSGSCLITSGFFLFET